MARSRRSEIAVDAVSARAAGALCLIALVSGACCLVSAPPAFAEAGDASVRVEYQFIRTGAFDSSIGDIDIGHTESNVLLLSADYALSDRWIVTASVPWIKKRHRGALPHNPQVDFVDYVPPDSSRIDDGNYHSDWEDFYGGLRYVAKSGPLTIQPFIAVGVPTNDYPVYAHAAVGRNIWHVPVGAAFGYQPYFSDFHYSGDIAYVFTEKTLGVDISHWLAHASIRYYVNNRFAPKVFATIKHVTAGLDFPDDYDLNDLDNARWYNHDRMIKHNYINGGLGFDWVINDRYQASVSAFTMVRPEQVNKIEYAFTVGITRFFSPSAD